MPRFQMAAAIIAAMGATALAVSLFDIVQAYPVFAQSIPVDELPKTDAEMSARASDLLLRYPKDPRSHMFRAIALIRANDPVGAEKELRTTLADEAMIRVVRGPVFEMNARALLATTLALQGESDKAKTEAKLACASTATPMQMRKVMDQIHLCD